MTFYGILLALAVSGSVLIEHVAHGHPEDPHRHPEPDPHGHEGPLVDAAISNVDMYFNDEVCKQLEHVDCHHHHIQHDERICGTDGHTYHTYPNHCQFAKARCTHHHTNGLYVSNHGPCQHHVAAISHVVNTAAVNVDMYYDKGTCEQIEHINCLHFQPVHDEPICGTDGKTYKNHCEFAMARCKLILDPHNYNHHTHTSIHILLVHNHGTCQQPQTTTTHVQQTTANTVASTATTSGQSTTMSHTSTTNSVTAASKTAFAFTTSPITSTVLPPTTTISLNSIMQTVFCNNINFINCNTGFNVVCGSDAKYYPNDCELAKAGCSNPNLKKEELTKCTVPSP